MDKLIIEQFIEAKWHTVPLKGELSRLNNSDKKNQPQFEKDWKKKYATTFNTQLVKLAGALTGKVSNILAIDCDNEETFNIFKFLDNDYKFYFTSKDKKSGGGTIIYKYDIDIDTFSINNDIFALDIFSDGGFIYLPTEHNYTKQEWKYEKLPEIKKIPAEIKNLLLGLIQRNAIKNENSYTYIISNRLAPMLETFIKTKDVNDMCDYMPPLFKIITPKNFRSLPVYVKQGHMHPNDVPMGRGSEYISKISAILGADISVSAELYQNVLYSINKLWDDPMDFDRLLKTIINPMIEGKSAINNKPIWQYDKFWFKLGFIGTTLRGDYFESFYDDEKGIYYLINYNKPYIRKFGNKTECLTTIRAVTGKKLTEGIYDSRKQLIYTDMDPSKDFGHIENSEYFNLFRWTLELNILHNHKNYTSQYKRPETIINYFNSLIPDDDMRAYILSFIKTKLTTFDYTPVILYFIGVPGSGKDTFIRILENILGEDYISKPTVKNFLSEYNSWLLDTFIVQLDEYGNSVNSLHQKNEVMSKIKSISGSPSARLRIMRTDSFNCKHKATIVMTSNKNPLPLEVDDRRIAFIQTPNKMERLDWVNSAGGVREIAKLIDNEIRDFCYYLATEVDILTGPEYVIAPYTKDKENLILDSLPAYEKISHYIENSKFEDLELLGYEFGVVDFCDGWSKGRILHPKLANLYEQMTEGQGSGQVIVKALKNLGIGRKHTTRSGENLYYYDIPNLFGYKTKLGAVEEVGPFKSVIPKDL